MQAAQHKTLFLAAMLILGIQPLAAHTNVAKNSRLGLDTSKTSLHQEIKFGSSLKALEVDASVRRTCVRSRSTGKERDAETGLDYFGARYLSGSMGRFTSPDAPFADQHSQDPQSWNLYGYARNNPLKFVDESGREVVYASKKLEIISESMRLQSPTYNAYLSGFEGLGAPDLRMSYGDTPKDPDGSPTDGVTSATSRGGPVLACDGAICAEKAPFGDQLKGTVDITINKKIEGDTDRTADVLGHEATHANDARTNTSTYMSEKKTDAKGKVIPHDARPAEQTANRGEARIKRERQDFAKEKPKTNQEIEKEKRRLLKEQEP
ncbi:MAG: RHS repeat-associated core domain-containing protein [Bryobacteraceae bacterium]|nr:RHS repeat-associated core domain-containing protein [Bryobacteraceae bacterium]